MPAPLELLPDDVLLELLVDEPPEPVLELLLLDDDEEEEEVAPEEELEALPEELLLDAPPDELLASPPSPDDPPLHPNPPNSHNAPTASTRMHVPLTRDELCSPSPDHTTRRPLKWPAAFAPVWQRDLTRPRHTLRFLMARHRRLRDSREEASGHLVCAHPARRIPPGMLGSAVTEAFACG